MRPKTQLLYAAGLVGALLVPVAVRVQNNRLAIGGNDACAQACTPQPLCDECSPQPFYSCSDLGGFIIVEGYRCTGGGCS